jgi:hypothetical protein
VTIFREFPLLKAVEIGATFDASNVIKFNGEH